MFASLETIDHQPRDGFPAKLDTIVTQLFDTLKVGTSVSSTDPLIVQMERLIAERFGMKVVYSPQFEYFSSAAVIPFFRDFQRASSALQVSGFSGSQDRAIQGLQQLARDRAKTLKKIDNKTGFINTKLAKMGGYLSEVKHYLIINFAFFKQHGLSAPEVSAVILHELGHAFDGMEEHYRLQSTNRAILDILVDVHGNKPDKALYKYKQTFTAKEYTDAQLSTSKDRQDFCGVLAARFFSQVESQLQSSKYDETNFENMADTFATRMGRGKELGSALAKLHGVSVDNSAGVRLVLVSLDILTLTALFLLVPIYGFILYTVVMSYLFRVSSTTMTYDGFSDRLQRIRNTIVHGIKNQSLPADLVSEALDQIEFIEKMAKAGAEHRSLTAELGDLLYSDARKDRYYIDLQQGIERQLNNRLFIQAARFRVNA